MLPEKHIRWRCRRGMKELDVLLERFFADGYEKMHGDHKNAFASLLELPDPELAAYLFGDAIAPERDLAKVAELIASYRG